MPLNLAINRSCAPGLTLDAFLDLARGAGAGAVEIRNDIPGREYADGTPPASVRARVEAAGLRVAAVNALQRFNDWTAARAEEARRDIASAAELGAGGLLLCPVVDEALHWTAGEAAGNLRRALDGLAPLFEGTGVTGLVEPLGMRGSTLKFQKDAVVAIRDSAAGAFRLCHDTFQFWRCGDARMFPEHFGLVHVSGFPPGPVPREDLTDAGRGLVAAGDRVGNLDQLRAIRAAGYDGWVSMETFDPALPADPDFARRLAESLDLLRVADPGTPSDMQGVHADG